MGIQSSTACCVVPSTEEQMVCVGAGGASWWGNFAWAHGGQGGQRVVKREVGGGDCLRTMRGVPDYVVFQATQHDPGLDNLGRWHV